MEVVRMLLVMMIVVIALVVLSIIIYDMIFSVKSLRTGLLVIFTAIRQSGTIGSIIAGPAEALVKTFVWV